jgi:hypothetical protein
LVLDCRSEAFELRASVDHSLEVAYAGPRSTRNGCGFQKAAIGMMTGHLVLPIGMEPVIGALLGPMLLCETLTLCGGRASQGSRPQSSAPR